MSAGDHPLARGELVTFSCTAGLGRVTLNRPEALNAWSLAFGRALTRVLVEEASAPEVRAVIIIGAGRAFSSGIDLRIGFSTGADGTHDLREELDVHHGAINATCALRKPVIAAVRGPAFGIGFSLALACDMIIASESAVFGPSWARFGLVPDGGSTLTLATAIGHRRAFELAALCKQLSGSQAAELGLANRVVPDDALDAEAEAVAMRLAAGPTMAYAALKDGLRAAVHGGFAGQLDVEERLQTELARTTDFLEGVSAFRESRPAVYTGA
ncbi:enoyl-CoA hydratase-related protein [Sporichthya sp.]|uniref:enoyl-CoA hydratase/isomerase family protein n=1 Tax=Sporichthya sp. TaxID=65475 RepID=UPI0017CD6F35|nr:enoyl-CoA hydratase-related protein [Sporichthya sp.]MBA3741523.1 enoyl-CoA hydratase/isomerase family protein [Sporichthya sp.]